MTRRRTAGPELPRATARISDGPLDPAGLLEGLGGPADGGVVLFVGRVRDENEGRRVARLEYEAYVEMAEEELARIVEEAAGRFEVGAIAAVHRVGILSPGEPGVAVAAAAPHRAAAYRASRAVMEAIKKRLPVWKREEYEDGTSRWLGSPAPAAGAAGRGGASGPADASAAAIAPPTVRAGRAGRP